MEPSSDRRPDHPVDPVFPARRSPRAMTGGHVDKATMMTLLEAARWAPSAFNSQPWRFLYALRGGPDFAGYLDLLTESNRLWARNAGALVLIASRTAFERDGRPSPTHSFDTGSAWISFALQGHFLGLVVHGMSGFDHDRARALTGLPDGYAVEAMAAVGHSAPPEILPESLRAKERPTQRMRVEEFAFEGRFPAA